MSALSPSPSVPEVRTIHCAQCGGAHPIVARPTPCPFCGSVQDAPAALLAELGAYQRSVEDERARVREHERAADQWRGWGDSRAVRTRGAWAIPFVFVFVLFPGLVFGLQALGGEIGLDKGQASFVAMGLFVACFAGYLAWGYGGRRRRGRAGASAQRVACPSCGAPSSLGAGAAQGVCAHCQAPLVPTHAVMERALDQVRLSARRAEIERHRVERAAMAGLYAQSMPNFATYYLSGMAVVLVGALTFAITFGAFENDRAAPAALPIVWAIFVALVAGLFAFFRGRARKLASYRRTIAVVARQLGGRPVTSTREVVGWLDAFWPAPYPTTRLFRGRGYVGSIVAPRGFAALLEVDPTGYAQGARYETYYPRRVEVLLASDLPASSPWPPAARPIVDELARAGFSVESTPAGLHATGDAARVRRASEDPESIASLTTVTMRLVALAEALGGIPAPPMD